MCTWVTEILISFLLGEYSQLRLLGHSGSSGQGRWTVGDPPYTGRKSHCKQHKRTCGTLSHVNNPVTEGLYCTSSWKNFPRSYSPKQEVGQCGEGGSWRWGKAFSFAHGSFLVLCSIILTLHLTSAHSSLSGLLLRARCSRLACHSGTQETEEASRWEIQGHPQLHTKFKANLDYMRSCLKTLSTLEKI